MTLTHVLQARAKLKVGSSVGGGNGVVPEMIKCLLRLLTTDDLKDFGEGKLEFATSDISRVHCHW